MNRPAKVDEVVIGMANKAIAIRANPSDGGPVMLSVRDRAEGVFGEAWLSQKAATRLYKLLGVALGLSLALCACGDNRMPMPAPDAKPPHIAFDGPLACDQCQRGHLVCSDPTTCTCDGTPCEVP